MRTKVAAMAALVVLWGAGMVWAEDAASKEVTLKGTLECAKCELHETANCQSVLKVSENGKDVYYYLDANQTSKNVHSMVCKKPQDNVTVSGTVSEKDGKKVIEATKIEMPKAEEKKG